MSDDFDFLRDDDDDELPDWLTAGNDDADPFGTDNFGDNNDDVASVEETIIASPSPYFDEPVEEEAEEEAEVDDFDLLRERTARNSEIYEDIDSLDGDGGGEGGFFGALSSFQKILLAVLVGGNVIAFICFILTFLGEIALF